MAFPICDAPGKPFRLLPNSEPQRTRVTVHANPDASRFVVRVMTFPLTDIQVRVFQTEAAALAFASEAPLFDDVREFELTGIRPIDAIA